MEGERQALLEFKEGLIDEADRLASWVGEENDCCRWAGIVCDNVTGHVHEIHLRALDGDCRDFEFEEADSKQRLKGNISSSLLHLEQLRYLDLSCNAFGWWEVPKFIGSLENLKHLNLSYSEFSWTFPPQLGNLSQLNVLSLGQSSLVQLWEGTSVMNMQWLSSLHQLHHLDLSGLDLSKLDWLEVINTLPSLVELHLSYCHLMDIHHHVSSLNITSLSLLDLSHNYFNSSLPLWIFSITSLVTLDLTSCDFHGPIPSSFRNLTSLQVLHVSDNDFMNSSLVFEELSNSNLISLEISSCGVSSSVLDSLHNLTSLLNLDISGNQLTKIPLKSLCNFCNLKEIDLSRNYDFQSISLTYLLESFLECKTPALESLALSTWRLSGQLPSQLGKLVHLQHLQLGYNNIDGVIPDFIGMLSFLRTLDLSYNLISGHIPFWIWQLPLLEVLFLQDNKLNGCLPDSIGRLSSLKELDVSRNQLDGSLPDSIGQLSSLKELDVSRNQLDGSLPDSIGRLSSLKELDVSRNQLDGSLPDSIGRLSSLKELDVSHNQLDGSLPDSIGRLSSLKKLDLSYNQLEGSLPNSLGELSNLEDLSFSSNSMTGVVTETHFAKLLSLEHLYGGGNNLTLRLRLANWIPPYQLKSLNLSSWRLHFWDISNTGITSSMPPDSFWISLPNLRSVDMSHCHIQGTLSSIPETLTSLDLSSNDFSGKLPLLTDRPPRLLDLSNNSFEGSLQHMLCPNEDIDMEILNLGNNLLSGVIPECWEKWTMLRILNLENNNLSGGIPRTLGSLYNLESLRMRGNKLSGRLPDSLMNLTWLNILQLGGNELVGSIPTWLGSKLSLLRLVNLRSNKFNGNVPTEICYLAFIQILDLADNNLVGNIPRCFSNFSVFSGKENASDGSFSYQGWDISEIVTTSDSLVMKGREDTYSTILPLVLLLDLSNNNLSGHIPSELTSLMKLTTLNLSRNHLTGAIPEKIGDMKSLETCDFSMNKLSGELPLSFSSLNFLSSFNVSYNNLTGRVPLSTQLQSFNESSFFGNQLCGAPLADHCMEVEGPGTKDHESDDGSHGAESADWGLVISMMLGFIVGFWVIVAPLIVSKSWRIGYFRFLSKLRYMVYDVIHQYCFNIFTK